ncbi:nucleotidyltransferase family protein [Hellea sp.]|nr:nucleotidyltransferase family protein [Hellea sp.]
MIKTAMVMAAGHGMRMRPLTNDRSKAMVEVGGRPLIDHMLDRLAEAGVSRAVVNVHAHADHLEAHLKARQKGPEIIISDEREELLETGGGVVKALPLLGTEPIFICNIDAIWHPFEPVFETLLKHWNPKKMDELLLCARADWSLGYSGKGDFHIDNGARLTRRTEDSADHIYAGVQIFKPALAKPFKIEKFSRNKIWDETLKRGKLFGVELPGYWMHVGDPKAVIAAEAVLKEVNRDNNNV